MSAPAPRPIDIAADHPAFDGHFPGQPLLPGVALLAEVLEAVRADPALRDWVGPSPRLAVAKFLAPVRPGAALTIDFRPGPSTLAWTVREGTRVAASGQFARPDPDAEASP